MRERRSTTVLGDLIALAVLLVALLLPDRLTRTDLGSFAAVPVELILAGVLLVVLPDRARRPVAAALGVALGLLTVLKILDIGFYGCPRPSVRPRPGLDPRAGGLGAAAELARRDSGAGRGRRGSAGAGSRRRHHLGGPPARSAPRDPHRRGRARARHPRSHLAHLRRRRVRAVPPYPVASTASSTKIIAEVTGVRDGLVDQERFAAELAQDRFRAVPPDQLLAGLRGKQVLLIFVESYGRVALTRPRDRPGGDRSPRGRDEAARAGGLAGPQWLPDLADRRRRQLAGPRHPALRTVGRQPAALPQPGGQRPAHLDPRVRRRRLAHDRRHAGQHHGLA